MNIASQISRIQNLVSELRTNIINKGVQLAADADLEDCVDAVPQISGGGGGTYPENEYLTIENTSTTNTSTITIKKYQISSNGSITSGKNYNQSLGLKLDYSLDKINWTTAYVSLPNYNSSANIYTLQPQDKIYLRSTNFRWSVKYYSNNIYFNVLNISSLGSIKVSGNIMSLLYGDDFLNKYFSGAYQFAGLFYNNVSIRDCSELFLPNCITEYCYFGMFRGCTNLTVAPSLPATRLASNCYNSMFYNCTSLTTAPSLPATTLAQNCYSSMFYGCNRITTAPSLPATTLAQNCYSSMFYNCTSLTTAPELLATDLLAYCYYCMFYNCNKINYIKAMFTTTPGLNLTGNWLYNVSATGTFVKNSAATWTDTGANAVPEGWTIETAAA